MTQATPQTPTVESIKADIIAGLDETYDLIYVDYRDHLTPDQVSAIVRNDSEALNDSIWEWQSESASLGARSAALEAANDYERAHSVPEDFDISDMAFEIEETIRNRDSSNPVKELASRTEDALLRVEVISEDDDLTGWKPMPSATYLTKAGLPVTDKNLATMTSLIAETPSEVHMGYVVFTASVTDLLATMGTEVSLTVENPEIVLGNPFTGGYWNATFEGVRAIGRDRLRTDKSAFGWSVDETYGGFIVEATATFPDRED